MLLGVRRGAEVRRDTVLEAFLGDLILHMQPLAELEQLVLRHLLDLVGGVAALEALAECPALHRLGEDDRRHVGGLCRSLEGGVDLLVVVPASRQVLDVAVGEVLDQLAQARVRPEEVLADVGAVLGRVTLVLAIDRGVHLVEEHAIDIAVEQLIPCRAPDDLDDVPSGPAEHALEFLDDLAVAANRAIEALQVAVDDPVEVAEVGTAGEGDGAERLGFVAFAVAQERPDLARAGVLEAAIVEVLVEAGVVDRVDRTEPHRHRRVLPEVRHEPRMRVARQSGPADLHAEVVEILFGEATFEVRTGVDARGGVALVVDVVAGEAVVLPLEEVVEPDLVERSGRREGGEVTADAVGGLVGTDHHRCGVPADERPDTSLDVLVAGEERLVLRRDRVDVGGRGGRGDADLQFVGPLQQFRHDVTGTGGALSSDDRIERVDPLLGLGRVDVGELSSEMVEHGLNHRRVDRGSDANRSSISGYGQLRDRCRRSHGRVHRRGVPREPRSWRLGLGCARRSLGQWLRSRHDESAHGVDGGPRCTAHDRGRGRSRLRLDLCRQLLP